MSVLRLKYTNLSFELLKEVCLSSLYGLRSKEHTKKTEAFLLNLLVNDELSYKTFPLAKQEKTPHKVGFPRLDRLAHWPFKKRRWVGVFHARVIIRGRFGAMRCVWKVTMRIAAEGARRCIWDAYEMHMRCTWDVYEMYMSRIRDAYETSSYLTLFHVWSYRCKRQSQCQVNVNVDLNIKSPIPRDVMWIAGKEILSLDVNPLSLTAWKLFPLKRSSI